MKILKLFIDENIKTWKKFSTKLAIILILLSLIAALGMSKILQYIDEKNEIQVVYESDWKSNIEEQIKTYKEELSDEFISQNEKAEIENRIKICEIRLENNIETYSSNWRNTILREMENAGTIDQDLLNLVTKNDFENYIKFKRENIKKQLDNKEITQEEYNDQISLLDLREKYQIGNNNGEDKTTNEKENVLTKISNEQKSIRTGINYRTNKVLSVDEKKKYEDDIKISIYKLEHNITDNEYSSSQNYRTIFESLAPSFVMVLIAIFAMIVAGSAISSEISTGTIKFWALTPNKRWKILTAKVLSLVFYLIIITLIMSILSIICSNIFFKTQGYEYFFVKDGNVTKIGNTMFIIEYYFAKLIPVVVFAIFAFMLSVITRNTSVALGLSLATYMGNSIAMFIINSYIKKDWVKFIPFNNLNIAYKIFPNFNSALSTGLENTASTSLSFSIIVLTICIILMCVTMYDSFNKRDII